MKKISILVIIYSLFSINAFSKEIPLNSQSYFIKNMGQWEEEVKFLVSGRGYNAWITDEGVVYNYYWYEYDGRDNSKLGAKPELYNFSKESITMESGHVVTMEFVGASANPNFSGNNKLNNYHNYFIGPDKSKWKTKVPLYSSVYIDNIYDGIDIKYYLVEGNLRYDFILSPGVSPEVIQMKFDGQDGLKINSDGSLKIKTSICDISHGKIFAYQREAWRTEEIECRFDINESGIMKFSTGLYDREKELIIDPLIYSSFLTGNGSEMAYDLHICLDESIVVTGETNSKTFYITNGAYQKVHYGNFAHYYNFITKFEPDYKDIIFSTYFGVDDSTGINYRESSIDENGRIYLCGFVSSTNLPVTENAYRKHENAEDKKLNCAEGYLTKFNSDGDSLIFSTYFGHNEGGPVISGMALDKDNNIYICGETYRDCIPISENAYQKEWIEKDYPYNLFVSKMNADGSDIIYSTYFSSPDEEDQAFSIDVDKEGCAYIAGTTTSYNFPVTENALQKEFDPEYGGKWQAFAVKFNPEASGLIYSTYLNYSKAADIKIGANGNSFLTGTAGGKYFITEGAYNNIVSEDPTFVCSLNPEGSGLIFSSVFGGILKPFYGVTYPKNELAFDNDGNIYIAHIPGDNRFPITDNAFQKEGGGDWDAAISVLSTGGIELLYSTNLGGSREDYTHDIKVDKKGRVHVCGWTGSHDFPITNDAVMYYHDNSYDAFVCMFDTTAPTAVFESYHREEEERLLVYPNPSRNGQINANLNLDAISDVEFELINGLGTVVYSKIYKSLSAGENSINLNPAKKLASGAYFLRASFGNGESVVRALIVE